MAFIVLGASRAYLTNNSQGGNPCLVLRFSFNNACLLEAALFTNVGLGYFCSNFILKKFNELTNELDFNMFIPVSLVLVNVFSTLLFLIACLHA